MTETDTLRVPYDVARFVGVAGGTVHALRLLLVAEHLRPDGATSIMVPLPETLRHVGGTLVTMRKAVANLMDLRLTTVSGETFCPVVNEPEPAEPEWQPTDDEEADGAPPYEDEDEDTPQPSPAFLRSELRVTDVTARQPVMTADERSSRRTTPGIVCVGFSDAWLALPRLRHVLVPANEVRALGTRCGLALRLRAAAWLDDDAEPRRISMPLSSMAFFASTDLVAAPATYWRGYLKPGLEDVASWCPSVALRVDEPPKGQRMKGIAFTVRHRRRRSRLDMPSKPSKPSVPEATPEV